jgi:hypothetical protein
MRHAQRIGPIVFGEGAERQRGDVIVLGLVLLVIGLVAGIPILWTLGILLIVVGAILALLGSVGRAVGGRRHYY